MPAIGRSISIVATYIAVGLDAFKPFARRTAVAVAFLQAAMCLCCVFSRSMLYGDGAYFVFALATGKPWPVKWAEISVRATIYLTTVLPTLFLGRALHLGGLDLAALNGLFFYGLPVLQFVWACAIVWRRNPQYLLFPIIQYAFSSQLGAGYPSEILLAPGFLWIAAFCVLENKAFSPSFCLAFLGGIFSHELAIPSMAVIGFLAYRQMRVNDAARGVFFQRAALLAIIMAAVVIFIYLRANGGGSGSDRNAVYVIDPRRILNNPSLWYMAACAAMGWGLAARPTAVFSGWRLVVLIIVIVATPLVISLLNLPVNFGQGRYDSARTLVAGMMFLLSLGFLVTQMPVGSTEVKGLNWINQAVIILAFALASNLGTAVAFFRDFTVLLDANVRIVTALPAGDAYAPTSERELSTMMSPRAAWISKNMDFSWTRVYRSAVIAPEYRPRRLIYDFVEFNDVQTVNCHRLGNVEPDGVLMPKETFHAVQTIICQPTDIPRPKGAIERLIEKFTRHSTPK